MLKFVFLFLGIALVSGGAIDSRKVREFESFLRKSVSGTYEEPLTPELEKLQNYWERSGKFEGDIVLTEEQIDSMVKEYSGERNSMLNTTRHWPNGVVYYSIEENDFDSAQIAAIEAGIKDIEELSCLTFKKMESETNYILITGANSGCSSAVGMAGGVQRLNLARNTPGFGCFRHGTVIHEFLHAVGFHHQQSTHNRDEWVKIVWEKIQPGKEHNFVIRTASQVTNFDIEYDYSSVLHYTEYGFSIDQNKTIIPLKPTDQFIGQRVGMSPGDIRKLNLMYKCISE